MPRRLAFPNIRAPRSLSDRNVIQNNWSQGIVRDTTRQSIPEGGIYDATDFFIQEPGRAWKRGGWARQSTRLGSCNSVRAVGWIPIPTRVVAVGDDNVAYDVTSENSLQATSIGACPAPSQAPTLWVDKLIFPYSDNSAGPKKVYYNYAGSAMAVANLGGTPPHAKYSCVYAGMIVLANGGAGDGVPAPTGTNTLHRVWFSPTPNPESTWDTTNSYIDVDHEVTGLAATSTALFVFGPHNITRILGDTPPNGDTDPTIASGNMSAAKLTSVGCQDARSIAYVDEEIIFAGSDGVYMVNSAGVESLTAKTPPLGIQKYWRDLFPVRTIAANHLRICIGGILNREFYIMNVQDENEDTIATLCCHLLTRSWTRLTNMNATMFCPGADEQNLPDLYMANADEGYVERLQPILFPTSSNTSDGNGTSVLPTLELKPFGNSANTSLQAYQYGWVSYDIRDPSSTNPTITVARARGLEAQSYTTIATLSETTQTKRKRFTCFADDNSMNLKLTQVGESTTTDIFSVELEVRPYIEASDA